MNLAVLNIPANDLSWPYSLTQNDHGQKVLSEFLAVELILNEIVPDIPKQEVIDPNDGFTNQVGLSGRDFNLSVPEKLVKF